MPEGILEVKDKIFDSLVRLSVGREEQGILDRVGDPRNYHTVGFRVLDDINDLFRSRITLCLVRPSFTFVITWNLETVTFPPTAASTSS